VNLFKSEYRNPKQTRTFKGKKISKSETTLFEFARFDDLDLFRISDFVI